MISERNEKKIHFEKDGSILKMTILEPMDIMEYYQITMAEDTLGVADQVTNNVLWDNAMQMVKKGKYYAFLIGEMKYNIRKDEDNVTIDVQKPKGDRTQEKRIEYQEGNVNYTYFSCEHDQEGSTFVTKYYDYPVQEERDWYFTTEEAQKEMYSFLEDLEISEEVSQLIDYPNLKENVLGSFEEKSTIK